MLINVRFVDIIMTKLLLYLLSSSASTPYGRITVPSTSRLVFDDTGLGGPAIELDTLGIQINVRSPPTLFFPIPPYCIPTSIKTPPPYDIHIPTPPPPRHPHSPLPTPRRPLTGCR